MCSICWSYFTALFSPFLGKQNNLSGVFISKTHIHIHINTTTFCVVMVCYGCYGMLWLLWYLWYYCVVWNTTYFINMKSTFHIHINTSTCRVASGNVLSGCLGNTPLPVCLWFSGKLWGFNFDLFPHTLRFSPDSTGPDRISTLDL